MCSSTPQFHISTHPFQREKKDSTMVFTVLAAADVFGLKLNYEFDFPVQPTMSEFQARVSGVFSADAASRRPEGAPPVFAIHRMQIFDDRTDQWNDLLSGAQLIDYCQVYAFQKESPWHREVQSKIPPAVKAPATHSVHIPVHVDTKMEAAPFPPLPAPVAASVPMVPLTTMPYTSIAAIPPPISAPVFPLPSVHPPVVPPVEAVRIPEVLPTTPRPAIVAMPDPSQCTFEHKVMTVFENLGPSVGRDAFAACLDALRIELGAEMVHTLFEKADANGDGVLQYGEFHGFCEGYPTVLDSMFYRHHDAVVDASQQEAVAQAKNTVISLRERESEARIAAVQSRRESDEQDQRVRQQALEVEAAERRELEAKTVLEATQHDVSRALNDVSVGRSDVTTSKENEQAKQVCKLKRGNWVSTTHHAVSADGCKARCREWANEAPQLRARHGQCRGAHAGGMIRAYLISLSLSLHLPTLQIERLLLEQQKEVDRQREAGIAARTQLLSSQASEQQAADAVREAELGTRVAVETLTQLENNLVHTQGRERECIHLLSSAHEDVTKCISQLSGDEQELRMCKEREAAKGALEVEAAKACEAQQDYAQILEKDNLEHNVKRRQAEERERPLLEQEVRLRLQRENLEMEEARLRTDHRTFHSSSGRIGPSSGGAELLATALGGTSPRAMQQPAYPAVHPPVAAYAPSVGGAHSFVSQLPTITSSPSAAPRLGSPSHRTSSPSGRFPYVGSPSRAYSPAVAHRRQSPPQSPHYH